MEIFKAENIFYSVKNDSLVIFKLNKRKTGFLFSLGIIIQIIINIPCKSKY